MKMTLVSLVPYVWILCDEKDEQNEFKIIDFLKVFSIVY